MPEPFGCHCLSMPAHCRWACRLRPRGFRSRALRLEPLCRLLWPFGLSAARVGGLCHARTCSACARTCLRVRAFAAACSVSCLRPALPASRAVGGAVRFGLSWFGWLGFEVVDCKLRGKANSHGCEFALEYHIGALNYCLTPQKFSNDFDLPARPGWCGAVRSFVVWLVRI